MLLLVHQTKTALVKLSLASPWWGWYEYGFKPSRGRNDTDVCSMLFWSRDLHTTTSGLNRIKRRCAAFCCDRTPAKKSVFHRSNERLVFDVCQVLPLEEPCRDTDLLGTILTGDERPQQRCFMLGWPDLSLWKRGHFWLDGWVVRPSPLSYIHTNWMNAFYARFERDSDPPAVELPEGLASGVPSGVT